VPQLRVGLAQVDVTVGDLAGNAVRIVEQVRAAADSGAHLVLLPEMALTGYPAEDLVLRHSFVAASRATLEQLAGDLAAAGLGDVAVVVGYVDACPEPTPRVGRPAGEPQDAAAVIHGGRGCAPCSAARDGADRLPS
jgi:NAD+ synthase (glutamine-hydrolysing)